MRAPFYGLRGRRSRGPAAGGSRPERGPRRRDPEQIDPHAPAGPEEGDAPEAQAPEANLPTGDGTSDDRRSESERRAPAARPVRRRGPGMRIQRRPDHSE